MKVTTGSKLTGGLGLAISYGRVLTLILFSVVALSAVAHEAVARDTTEYAADSLSRTLNEVVVEAETIKRDGNHEIMHTIPPRCLGNFPAWTWTVATIL